jgi:PAS domain S-box-containing protein
MSGKKVKRSSGDELNRLAEKRLREKIRTDYPRGIGEESLRLLHELQVHQIELEMQNENLLKERAKLEQMEAELGKYKDLYDFATVGYFNLDHRGTIHAVNLTGSGFLGIERSLLINRPLEHFISAETRPVFQEFLANVFASKTKKTCELVFLKERNTPLFVQVEAVISESIEVCRAVVIDITERKQTEMVKSILTTLVESSDDVIYIEDITTGTILSWNAGAERLYGYHADEVIGKSITLLIPPEFQEEEYHILQRLSAGERFDHFETVRLAKGGQRFDVSVTASPIIDGNGRILAASKICRNITERKRAEAELKKLYEELELRVAERTAELAVTIENLQVEISKRKKAEERALRLNRLYSVLSKTNQAIIRIKDRETLFNDFCRIAVKDGSFKLAWVGLVDEGSGELKVVAANGATGYLEDIRITIDEEPAGLGPTGISVRNGTYYICNDFLGSPVTRPWQERGRTHGIRASASIALKQEGRVIGALTLYANKKDFFDQQQVELLLQMGADISFALDYIVLETRRQETEKALHEETTERLRISEELREKDRLLLVKSRQAAMGETIDYIAHQWKQPLNILSLVVQVMRGAYQDGELTGEDMDKASDQIMEIVTHMSQTINDFRSFTSPDREMKAFELNEMVNKTLALVDDCLKENKIQVTIKAEDALIITGYQNEYCHVLLNILNNAREALVERNISSPQIEINLYRESGRTVATISDNAGGIPEEIIGRVFDMYFSTKEEAKGTGIGLYMSKTIIEKHMNGKLTVRNTKEGAEFRIEV